MARLQEGQRLLVEYDGEPGVLHERVIVRRVRDSRYFIATADGDVYEEDYSAGNTDIVRIRLMQGGNLPAGIGVDECYMFDAVFGPEGLRTAQAEADDEMRRYADVDGVRGGEVRLDRPGVRAAGPGGEVGQWWCGEVTAGGRFRGEAVPGGLEPRQVPESRRSAVLWGTEYVFIIWMTVDEKEAWLKLQAPVDSRILAVRQRGGRRDREWVDASDGSVETSYSDWPVKGPRTVSWCMEFLQTQSGGASGHHLTWRRLAGVSPEDYGVNEHSLILEAMAIAAKYDQINLKNSAAFELLARRMQTIEFAYSEAVREAHHGGRTGGGGDKNKKSGGGGGFLSVEEADAFSGLTKHHGVMICPKLLEFVRDDVKNNAELMKVMVKAREFREALKKK